MVQSRNVDSKFDQDDLCSLQDHELDRVTGGVANLPSNLMAILQQENSGGLEVPHIGCPRL
jgi:hypothetical protein